jgi:hypothetical protein
MENILSKTERELKIKNLSYKTLKNYRFGLREYFTFKEKTTPSGFACHPF